MSRKETTIQIQVGLDENQIPEKSILEFRNDNNSLESMKLNPCLGKDTNRLTCYSAPAWWYPYDKYDSDKFREIYYGDYFNPIYNYLGNAQDMYWDFKSVKNS